MTALRLAVPLAVLGLPLLLAAAPAAAQTMTYDTDSGPLTLTFQPPSHVTGVYPDYGGQIKGTLTAKNRIEGTWWQTKAASDDTACKTEVNGTRYWGKVVLLEDADEQGFHGRWGSCDGAPDGDWVGKLRK